MRVDNKSVDTVLTDSRTAATSRVGQDTLSGTQKAAGLDSDHANLSSASSLVSLAKTMVSPERQAKISALAAQIRSGSYHADTGEAGQAMVQELLQRR